METVYFFLLIFCGIYGALKLTVLFYRSLTDKLSAACKHKINRNNTTY